MVAFTVLSWRKRHGSIQQRVECTIVLGALVGVGLQSDLRGVMFWGQLLGIRTIG
jgi:hypothetical protein